MVPLHAGVIQQIGRHRVTGKQENPAFRDQLTHPDRSFYPVYAGHHYVTEQEIRLPMPSLFDRRMTIVDGVSLKPALSQDDCERIGDCALVVSYEYL